MKKEKILHRIRNLPTKLVGEMPEDHQIFEGNKFGAHFKVTKELIPVADLIIYSLSVSEEDSVSRNKLIGEFIAIFGPSFSRQEFASMPGIDFVVWEAPKVDEYLKSI